MERIKTTDIDQAAYMLVHGGSLEGFAKIRTQRGAVMGRFEIDAPEEALAEYESSYDDPVTLPLQRFLQWRRNLLTMARTRSNKT